MMGKRMKYARKVLQEVKNLFGCASLPSHCSVHGVADVRCLRKNSNVHQPESEAGVSIDVPCITLADLIQLENSKHVSSSRPRHTLHYLMQLEDTEDAAHFRYSHTLRYLMQLEDLEDASHLRSRQAPGSPMQLEDKKDASLHTCSDLPVGEFDTVMSVLVEGNEDNMNTSVAVDTDNVLEISPITSVNKYEVEGGTEAFSIVYDQYPTFGGEHERHDQAHVASYPSKVMRIPRLVILLLLVFVAGVALFG